MTQPPIPRSCSRARAARARHARPRRRARPDLLDRCLDLSGTIPSIASTTARASPNPRSSAQRSPAGRGLADERPGAVAGHSLGELAALAAAGAVDARRRARARRAARRADGRGRRARGTMLALLGAIEDAAQVAADHGVVVANDNAPGQIVLSGDREHSPRRGGAREAGLRAMRLRVAGAFHSPAMDPAVPVRRRARRGRVPRAAFPSSPASAAPMTDGARARRRAHQPGPLDRDDHARTRRRAALPRCRPRPGPGQAARQRPRRRGRHARRVRPCESALTERPLPPRPHGAAAHRAASPASAGRCPTASSPTTGSPGHRCRLALDRATHGDPRAPPRRAGRAPERPRDDRGRRALEDAGPEPRTSTSSSWRR